MAVFWRGYILCSSVGTNHCRNFKMFSTFNALPVYFCQVIKQHQGAGKIVLPEGQFHSALKIGQLAC